MTDAEQREAARQFANKWKGRGREDEDGRSYWIDFLSNVLGMENVTDRVEFEKKVVVDGNTKRIDVYIPETHVLIEQKSLGKALDHKIMNSGSIELTPYDQAKRYNDNLPYDEKARWIITSNFSDIWIYDMNARVPEFPYVNGGLFSDETIEIPPLTEEIKELLLTKASEDFDWSDISPTIFGAVFESTLNPETRRSGGMHYTSISNIHKVIDPLFLDELQTEFHEILKIQVQKTKVKRLDEFQNKLASLTFLDPACGSGNFLTETYLSLRRLENEVIREKVGGQMTLGDVHNPIRVSIQQFYGIEINDFAVTVAKTALWIAESQMMEETKNIVYGFNDDFLPLKTYVNITEGNALRLDWNNVISKSRLNYVMGNPPFVGARWMNKDQKKDQKKDMEYVFQGIKDFGNLDFVTAWYKKASDYILNTDICVSFVSTNTITQGEQPAIFWKPLFEMGIHINYAYRTFQWDSEANLKAHVHCVIVGFSHVQNNRKKILFDVDGVPHSAKNINAYLIDADNVFVASRKHPICDVPEIGIGNKPIDGGYYLFEKDEMVNFVKKEPKATNYFHPWYGAREFINQKPRYCLYLGNCVPSELRKMPECMKRVEAVREYRLNSTSAGTRKIADNPTRFHVSNFPKGNYIVIPQVSSDVEDIFQWAIWMKLYCAAIK